MKAQAFVCWLGQLGHGDRPAVQAPPLPLCLLYHCTQCWHVGCCYVGYTLGWWQGGAHLRWRTREVVWRLAHTLRRRLGVRGEMGRGGCQLTIKQHSLLGGSRQAAATRCLLA